MSSSHSENQRAELNGTEPTDEELTAVPAQHDAVYEPGPSFLEHDRPAVRLVELPAWLQRFAASTGEPDEEAPATDTQPAENITHLPAPIAEAEVESSSESEPDDAPLPEVPSIELPSWLNDDAPVDAEPATEPEISEPIVASEPPLPGSPQFMISEDDLPDWLRTISPDDGDDVAVGVGANEQVAAAGIAGVPSVARAWVTRDEMEALSEGGSLFALVASQSSSTNVVDASEPAPAPARGRRGHAASGTPSEATVTPTASSEESAQAESETAAAEADAEERKFRLFPILVGSLLVIIIVLIAMNFL